MKYIVHLDKDGNLISASHRPELESFDYLTHRGGPVPKEGESVVELDLPQDYAGTHITGVMERLQEEGRVKLQKMKKRS
jgi:hypothetical protein